MAEVYEGITGCNYSGHMRGSKKEEIASSMASQIMAERVNDFFRAKSVAEKSEEIKKLNVLLLKLAMMTLSEL